MCENLAWPFLTFTLFLSTQPDLFFTREQIHPRRPVRPEMSCLRLILSLPFPSASAFGGGGNSLFPREGVGEAGAEGESQPGAR